MGKAKLRSKAPFPATTLADVAGMFKGQVQPKTDTEINAAIKKSQPISE